MVTDNKEETNRMWANASFVCVLIVIGLPLWWKTTEVYRVSLPYDKINAFDPQSLSITTELTVMAYDESTAAEVIGLIEKTFKDIDVLKLKITKTIMSEKLRHTVNSAADEEDAVDELSESVDMKKDNTLYVVQRKPLFQQVWLGDEPVVFFRDSKAAPTLVETLVQWVYRVRVAEGARAEAADSARRTRVPPARGYHVVLSVAHPRPDALHVDFDAGTALEDYIGSFADELSVLHNLTLKSQWLYLLNFDFQATEVKDASPWGRHFAVRSERLPQLLTRLEERTATHVSELPAVNLVLYAVPCDMAPLVIYDKNDKKVVAPTQAFMSPKWGGVVLGNPTKEECDKEKPTWRPPVRIIMGTFISQLRKLLGISTDMEEIPGSVAAPLRGVAPRAWERAAALRVRALELAASARHTLRSLAQLLGTISNIVINDEVGASINTAVENIELADELMARGELVEAYEASLRAYLAAETAFMEPSLLALLYFPDDQKYAIYIPLFLPIMFPVVLSLKTLLLWLRGKSTHKEKTE